MASTLIAEFHKGMREHFNIQNPGEYIDKILSMTTHRVHLDTIKLDDWLHEQHGQYELERNMSMANFLVKEYSQAAHDFVLKFL
jgi:hypothetical protein